MEMELMLQENVMESIQTWHNIEKSFLIESTKCLAEGDSEGVAEVKQGTLSKIGEWFKKRMASLSETKTKVLTFLAEKFNAAKTKVMSFKPGKDKGDGEVEIESNGSTKKIKVTKETPRQILNAIAGAIKSAGASFDKAIKSCKDGFNKAKSGKADDASKAKDEVIESAKEATEKVSAVKKLFGVLSNAMTSLKGKLPKKDSEVKEENTELSLEESVEELNQLIESLSTEEVLEENTFAFMENLFLEKKCGKKTEEKDCKKSDEEDCEDEEDEDDDILDEICKSRKESEVDEDRDDEDVLDEQLNELEMFADFNI